jgi:hypothetical protein
VGWSWPRGRVPPVQDTDAELPGDVAGPGTSEIEGGGGGLEHRGVDLAVTVTAARGRRFRAACAIAGYDPGNPRWTSIAREVVVDLAMENPLLGDDWARALEGVGERLSPHLIELIAGGAQTAPDLRMLAGLYDARAVGLPISSVPSSDRNQREGRAHEHRKYLPLQEAVPRFRSRRQRDVHIRNPDDQ